MSRKLKMTCEQLNQIVTLAKGREKERRIYSKEEGGNQA